MKGAHEAMTATARRLTAPQDCPATPPRCSSNSPSLATASYPLGESASGPRAAVLTKASCRGGSQAKLPTKEGVCVCQRAETPGGSSRSQPAQDFRNHLHCLDVGLGHRAQP